MFSPYKFTYIDYNYLLSLTEERMILCLFIETLWTTVSPGSSVRGILQARILEWVAVPSSRGLPNPRIELPSCAAPALQADSLPLSPEGSTSSFRPIQFYPTLRKPFLVPTSWLSPSSIRFLKTGVYTFVSTCLLDICFSTLGSGFCSSIPLNSFKHCLAKGHQLW